jgi:hypothetical protein
MLTYDNCHDWLSSKHESHAGQAFLTPDPTGGWNLVGLTFLIVQY